MNSDLSNRDSEVIFLAKRLLHCLEDNLYMRHTQIDHQFWRVWSIENIEGVFCAVVADKDKPSLLHGIVVWDGLQYDEESFDRSSLEVHESIDYEIVTNTIRRFVEKKHGDSTETQGS